MKVGKLLDTVLTNVNRFRRRGRGVSRDFVAVPRTHALGSIGVPFYAFLATFVGPIVAWVDLEAAFRAEIVGICVNLHAPTHGVVDVAIGIGLGGSGNIDTGGGLEAVSRTETVGFGENVHAGTQDVVCSGDWLAVVVGIARPGIIAGIGHRRQSKGDQQTQHQGVPPTHLANVSGTVLTHMVVLVIYRTAAGSAMHAHGVAQASGALVSSVLAMTGLAEKAGRRVEIS